MKSHNRLLLSRLHTKSSVIARTTYHMVHCSKPETMEQLSWVLHTNQNERTYVPSLLPQTLSIVDGLSNGTNLTSHLGAKVVKRARKVGSSNAVLEPFPEKCLSDPKSKQQGPQIWYQMKAHNLLLSTRLHMKPLVVKSARGRPKAGCLCKEKQGGVA